MDRIMTSKQMPACSVVTLHATARFLKPSSRRPTPDPINTLNCPDPAMKSRAMTSPFRHGRTPTGTLSFWHWSSSLHSYTFSFLLKLRWKVMISREGLNCHVRSVKRTWQTPRTSQWTDLCSSVQQTLRATPTLVPFAAAQQDDMRS